MKLPDYGFLIPAALLLGLAPFVPEPHLLEKIRWLLTGHPFRAIDVFDLFLHGAFPVLLVVRVSRDLSRLGKKGQKVSGNDAGGGPEALSGKRGKKEKGN